jgi:two-component system, chemotaxis family, chemotaxis protein CheY
VLALVVDDSSAMRKIIGRILTGLGFDIVEAENGRAALDVLESGTVPDIALVDWNMPVMDGLTLVHEVRANEAWREVSLMMVTTESEQSQIVRALAAGAHEYLIKPFTPDSIADKLEMLGVVPGGQRL